MTALIRGEMCGGVQHLVLYDASGAKLATEVSPGAGPKLEAIAAEAGATKVLCLYDQRKDQS